MRLSGRSPFIRVGILGAVALGCLAGYDGCGDPSYAVGGFCEPQLEVGTHTLEFLVVSDIIARSEFVSITPSDPSILTATVAEDGRGTLIAHAPGSVDLEFVGVRGTRGHSPVQRVTLTITDAPWLSAAQREAACREAGYERAMYVTSSGS